MTTPTPRRMSLPDRIAGLFDNRPARPHSTQMRLDRSASGGWWRDHAAVIIAAVLCVALAGICAYVAVIAITPRTVGVGRPFTIAGVTYRVRRAVARRDRSGRYAVAVRIGMDDPTRNPCPGVETFELHAGGRVFEPSVRGRVLLAGRTAPVTRLLPVPACLTDADPSSGAIGARAWTDTYHGVVNIAGMSLVVRAIGGLHAFGLDRYAVVTLAASPVPHAG